MGVGCCGLRGVWGVGERRREADLRSRGQGTPRVAVWQLHLCVVQIPLETHECLHTTTQPTQQQEGDGLSPTAIREILLLRELRHEHIVKLTAVHINRQEPSLSLAFDYAEHDLYEIIWHHRDRLAGTVVGSS